LFPVQQANHRRFMGGTKRSTNEHASAFGTQLQALTYAKAAFPCDKSMQATRAEYSSGFYESGI
jgi:hypothetical protein